MKINTLLKALVLFMFSIALYAQEGAIDLTFNPEDNSIHNGFDDTVYDLEVLPDGKVMYAGAFYYYRDAEVHYIVRTNQDNTIDTTFNLEANINGYINVIEVQSDGKILIAGNFNRYGDVVLNGFARLNADGSLDTTFQSVDSFTPLSVYEIKELPDGKILVAGSFNGAPNRAILMLNADGTVDESFVLDQEFSHITALEIQAGGGILVGGYLRSVSSQVVRRLTPSGSTDLSFETVLFSNYIARIKTQFDGSVIVGGEFSYAGGLRRVGIAKLSASGGIDDTFNADISDSVYDIQLMAEDKILIIGNFLDNNTNGYNGILRLNADGRIDSSFYTSGVLLANHESTLCAAIKESTLIIGGSITNYDSVGCNKVIYLNLDGTRSVDFELTKGADVYVSAITDAGNGNMLIGGGFVNYNGVPKNRLVLIDANGAIVEGFDIGEGPNGGVSNILKQSNGKFIIRGGFTEYNGVNRSQILRINQDGSLDTAYDLSASLDMQEAFIRGIAIQPDNKLLLFGTLTLVVNGEHITTSVCRFNEDGRLDSTFTFLSRSEIPLMNELVVLPDGSFLCQIITSQYVSKIIKLNADGLQNTSFLPFLDPNNDYNLMVNNIVPDKNGKYYISQSYRPTPQSFLTNKYRRMDANGIFDDSEFSTPYYNGNYSSIVYVQNDLKFFATSYTGVNDRIEMQLKRYNPDGSEDTSFETLFLGYYDYTNITCLPQENKLVLAGNFTFINGVSRNRVARINSTGAALQTEVPKAAVKPSLIASKKNNAVDVECSTGALSSVAVYDLSGRLVAKADELHDNTVSLKCSDTTDGLLIVTAKLQDGSTVVKKIM